MRMFGEGFEVGIVVRRLHLDVNIESSLISIRHQFNYYPLAKGKIRMSSQGVTVITAFWININR